jgi:hypothetical protein
MTVTLSKPTVWGVRHNGNPGGVDVRADEADARRWLSALMFCGNTAQLVVRDAASSAWRTAPEVTR